MARSVIAETGHTGSRAVLQEAGLDLYDRHVRTIPDAKMLTASKCPVCDATEARPRFEVEGIEPVVAVCTTCGLGRFVPMPEPDEISSFYPSEYYGPSGTKFRPLVEWLVRIVGARHIAFLSRGLPAGAQVLDVGCGRGVLLGRLADRGSHVHGVEMSEEAAAGADPRADVRIAPRLSDAVYPACSFDQIILWHVLEHLPDPRATLIECQRIMRPGGRLIVAVPNFSSLQARLSGPAWFHLDAPRHLYHFPLPALRRLIERCGFRCGRAYHFSLRQNPFGWIQSALNLFSSQRPNQLYTFLQTPGQDKKGRTDRATLLRMWAILLLAAPPACALTVLETILRRGGTVHIVATRQHGPSAVGTNRDTRDLE
jgi:SAM-dependent methyltransferase